MAKIEQKPIESVKGRWSVVAIVLICLTLISFISALIIGVFIGSSDLEPAGNIAKIDVEGAIMQSADDSFMGEGGADADDIVELIERADNNPEVKAILLEINSPGGSAVASYEIADAVKKANKTTVAVIREVGASGAYWVASATDHVIANPMSITGRIGVISSYLDFSGFINRYNVSYQRLVSGYKKDMMTPFRPMNDDEEKLMQDNLDTIRAYFVNAVAKNRNMSVDDVNTLADGRFYLGVDAKELGLIDDLGGMDDAIAWIEKKEGITAEIANYETPKTFMESLLGTKASNNVGYAIGQGLGDSLARAQSEGKITT
jgi:protease-4